MSRIWEITFRSSRTKIPSMDTVPITLITSVGADNIDEAIRIFQEHHGSQEIIKITLKAESKL